MPFDHQCEVLDNRVCGRGLKVLRLKTLDKPFSCQAGQFVMLDLPERQFFFRRPFSVLDTPEPQVFVLYYKVVGTGTAMMEAMLPGTRLKVLGPLGNTFTPPEKPEKALFIGGGIGIAPLYLLGKETGAAGKPHCFYGVRSQAEIGLEPELKSVFGAANLHIATDDGSYGYSGNVCDLLSAHRELVQTAETAYICGPTRMMEATVALLNRLNPEIRIEVSLEEHMPCGTGACTGCVVPRSDQYLPSKVCVEGPVFDARCILWPSQQTQPKVVAACPS